MWTTFARRAIFFSALLATGAITISCFHLTHNTQWSRTVGGDGLKALGKFAWGADSLGLVLGVWLAGRTGVWRSWSGWLRAAAYLLAYTYGRMLFSATQYWLAQRAPDGNAASGPIAFRWPGGELQDFARPALDLLTLLMLVWLLVPLFTLTRSALAEDKNQLNARSTFSLASILGWTTVAAFILLWIRFLTWKGVSPQTAYSFMTPTQALTEYAVENLPGLLIEGAAVLILLWGWSGRWWWPIVALVAALLVDSLGHKALYAILAWIRGNLDGGNVLTGTALEHWSYLAGQNLMVWSAFGMARLTGVRLSRAPRAQSKD